MKEVVGGVSICSVANTVFNFPYVGTINSHITKNNFAIINYPILMFNDFV